MIHFPRSRQQNTVWLHYPTTKDTELKVGTEMERQFKLIEIPSNIIKNIFNLGQH